MATESKKSETEPRKVGYRNPPVASRFPRGTSGNPLGRPKSQRGKVTLGGAMRELLMSDVAVVIEGRRRRMLRIEALADALMGAALEGNASAAKLVLDLAYKFVPPHKTVDTLMEGGGPPTEYQKFLAKISKRDRP
ncbi:MAG: DUF5681 domain-containing protein [Reyranellaceae bacterium]